MCFHVMSYDGLVLAAPFTEVTGPNPCSALPQALTHVRVNQIIQLCTQLKGKVLFAVKHLFEMTHWIQSKHHLAKRMFVFYMVLLHQEKRSCI